MFSANPGSPTRSLWALDSFAQTGICLKIGDYVNNNYKKNKKKLTKADLYLPTTGRSAAYDYNLGLFRANQRRAVSAVLQESLGLHRFHIRLRVERGQIEFDWIDLFRQEKFLRRPKRDARVHRKQTIATGKVLLDWLQLWQSVSQSINQPFKQSGQSINQSVIQTINQSVSQSTTQSVVQSISHSISSNSNQTVNQSMSLKQRINQSVIQSIPTPLASLPAASPTYMLWVLSTRTPPFQLLSISSHIPRCGFRKFLLPGETKI